MIYKKTTSLDKSLINQIRMTEQPLILERIKQKNINLNIFKYITFKRVILSMSVILLLLVSSLFITNQLQQPSYTFKEVYSELLMLEERFKEIANVNHQEAHNIIQLRRLDSNYVRSYEQLHEIYETFENDYENTDHLEYLLITYDYYQTVIRILSMYEDLPLYKWVDTVDDDYYSRFKILVHDNYHFTLVTYNVYGKYSVFYIGLTDGLFDIEHIMYTGDILEEKEHTTYNYFAYREDSFTKFIHINEHIEDEYSYMYYDFASNTYESFNRFSAEDDGIYYSTYNTENNVSINVWFKNNNIFQSGYTFYNDHGILFNYIKTASNTSLTFNLLETTGWDYASYNPYDETENGIYKDDIKLFSDQKVTVEKIGDYVNANLYYETTDPITDDLLSLRLYDLEFNQSLFTLEKLDSIIYTDVSTLQEDIVVDGYTYDELIDPTNFYHGFTGILKNAILSDE